MDLPGTVDSTFDSGGPNGRVLDIALQPNGQILICGNFTDYNGDSPINRILRINTDGSIDNAFLSNMGSGFNDTVRSLVLQPDGKILVGGDFTSFNSTSRKFIARLNANGTLDGSFNLDATEISGSFVSCIALQSDGKILIGGAFILVTINAGQNNIARLKIDGSIEGVFNLGSGASDGIVNDILVQPDEKIVIGGEFTTFNGTTAHNRLVRLTPSGAIDPSFFIAETGTYSSINGDVISLALQDDGKLLVGGTFDSYNNLAGIVNGINRIVRLDTTGKIDTIFNSGTGIEVVGLPPSAGTPSVYSITIQPNGKILIGGFFTRYNGYPIKCIARLNTNGLIDTSFNPGISANDLVRSLVLQMDGDILVGGSFTAFNNDTNLKYLLRLYGGELPNSFVPRVNPFITLGPVLVYTKEAVDALVAGGSGATLPPTTRVSWAPLGVPAGSLLRDLGRLAVVRVSDSNPLHAYRFQRVQLIAGAGTEGVGGSATDTDAWQTGYICTWAAGGSPPIF
jgi:uncharacterized delta-60 repeat protein